MKAGGKARFYKNLDRTRRTVQVISMVFLLAVPILNWLGVHWIIGTLYSISVGDLVISDPLMVMQTVLLTKTVYVPLLVSAVIPVVLALVFGKVFCSWMCPHNTISEWLGSFSGRVSKRRWRAAHFKTQNRNPKAAWYWGIFAGLVLLMLVLGLPIFSYLSTPGILSSEIAQSILGMGVGLELLLVALILILEGAILRRYWCKILCPVGACLALFRTRRTLHLKHDAAYCDCAARLEPCHYACPLDLSPKQPGIYPYCFNCGLCISACEKTGKSALSFEFGLPPRKSREGEVVENVEAW